MFRYRDTCDVSVQFSCAVWRTFCIPYTNIYIQTTTDPGHPRDAAGAEGEEEEAQPLLGLLELLAPVLSLWASSVWCVRVERFVVRME